jgi:hypothetical protein
MDNYTHYTTALTIAKWMTQLSSHDDKEGLRSGRSSPGRLRRKSLKSTRMDDMT